MCYYAIPLKGFSHFSSHSRLSLESQFSIATFGCGSSHTPQYAPRREVHHLLFKKPPLVSWERGGEGLDVPAQGLGTPHPRPLPKGEGTAQVLMG